jgi:uncharacterized Zn-binding protein involved in type VI secretion
MGDRVPSSLVIAGTKARQPSMRAVEGVISINSMREGPIVLDGQQPSGVAATRYGHPCACPLAMQSSTLSAQAHSAFKHPT